MRIETMGTSSNASIKPTKIENSPRMDSVDPTSEATSEIAVSLVESERNPEDPQASMITDKMLDKAVEQANKSLIQFDRVIERSVHEKTGTVMYVIRDAKTNEVIGEFPPKKIQDMIAKMWELAGLFVDEKA